MEKILADSCIFIDIFRGNHQLYNQLSTLNVSINSIIYMELIQGAQNKTELKEIDRFLKSFEMVGWDDQVSQTAMELMKKYSLSYGLLIPDAVIAATALCKGYKLWTFNRKDYKFIKNLVLFEL